MAVCITGWRSKIAGEFRAMLPDGEKTIWGKPCEPEFPGNCDRYLFCHGLLRSKKLEDQTESERDESWLVNYIATATCCDWILHANPMARICIIGSESAYRESFDGNYSVAKAAIHRYVEVRRLPSPNQQLVAISPSIIADSGMTERRKDTANLARRKSEHPMRRFLFAKEVAAMAYHLLYEQPYVSGTVVRMHGGLK